MRLVPRAWVVDIVEMRPRFCFALLTTLGAAFALGSCSYVYTVEARVIGGRLAFVSLDDDFECVNNAQVTTQEAARPAPAPTDNVGLISNGGAFWWVSYPASCEVEFPLLYGQSGIGADESVKAKPLRVGVVYDISIRGDNVGYGYGRFRITPDRRVENLPHEASLEH